MNYRDGHGDIVSEALNFYRERTNVQDESVPKAYKKIKNMLEQYKREGKRILVETSDSYSFQSLVLTVDYVADRWFKGTFTCYYLTEEIPVPYVINYSDIYAKNSKVKIVQEGENPYGEA